LKVSSQVTIRTAQFAAVLIGSSAVASAQPREQPQADSTKMNQRDQHANEPIADQQKAGRSDREITQEKLQAQIR
jgi:hypothetical protein